LKPFETVTQAMHELREATQKIGCTIPEPFLQVAFLALPVIPHLKLTDMGLFDVDRFGFVA
ncbi:adenine deaminase C-terminal domain-containing protein, partial [Mesorhizobium sp.]